MSYANPFYQHTGHKKERRCQQGFPMIDRKKEKQNGGHDAQEQGGFGCKPMTITYTGANDPANVKQPDGSDGNELAFCNML